MGGGVDWAGGRMAVGEETRRRALVHRVGAARRLGRQREKSLGRALRGQANTDTTGAANVGPPPQQQRDGESSTGRK